MGEAISLWPLTGIAVIVVGFLLRFNPVLVVIVAGIVTGLAAHMPIATILEKLGEGFLNTRNLPFILLIPLAVIGLLERHGLKERAQAWIARIKSATSGRLLIVYLFIREATAALGLTSLGGHPQMVRPLLAPMAEGATESRYGKLFYSCNTYPDCNYATWNPPIAEACPNCGWPVLTIKTTKRWGVEKVCPQKECGWKEQIEPPAPKGAKTDEA